MIKKEFIFAVINKLPGESGFALIEPRNQVSALVKIGYNPQHHLFAFASQEEVDNQQALRYTLGDKRQITVIPSVNIPDFFESKFVVYDNHETDTFSGHIEWLKEEDFSKKATYIVSVDKFGEYTTEPYSKESVIR